jgi:hypothetical protein
MGAMVEPLTAGILGRSIDTTELGFFDVTPGRSGDAEAASKR